MALRTNSSAARASAVPGTWARTFGDKAFNRVFSVAPTSDGGYIAAGETVAGSHGMDAWVFKLDGAGTIVWQKSYGGTGTDSAISVIQTEDGGFIAVGGSSSFSVDSHAWAFKLDSVGNIVWQKTYGYPDYYSGATSIVLAHGGGYIVSGELVSTPIGDDFWIFKLDSLGNMLWQKTYGGAGMDYPSKAIAPTDDGGYVIAGQTFSFGDVKGDAWVVKLDGSGNVAWQKTYGGTEYDFFASIAPIDNDGYIATGLTASFGGGSSDAWVVRLDNAGNIKWQKALGGTNGDQAIAVALTADTGYLVVGYTASFGAGDIDAWALKLDDSGNVVRQMTYGGSKGDYAFSVLSSGDNGFLLAGQTFSFGIGEADAWIVKLDANGKVGGQCSLGTVSSALVASSAASSADTLATVTNSTVTPTSSNVPFTNSTAQMSEQCSIIIPTITVTKTPTTSNTPTVTQTHSPSNSPTRTPARSRTQTRTNTPTRMRTSTTTRTRTPTYAATRTPTTIPTSCAGKPTKPKLRKPADGATFTHPRVTLKWKVVTCAQEYKIVVRQDDKKGPKVDSSKRTTLSYRTEALAKNHTYYWFVKACTPGFGCTKSGVWQFNLLQW